MSFKIMLLSKKVPRAILFFIFHKKVNRKIINKKIDKLMHCNDFYEKKSKIITKDLIVSLTSFPDRIDEVQYTVYSLLNQSLLPEKIILWLAREQFEGKEKNLPSKLIALQNATNRMFEIYWCKDMRSYKKLIPLISSSYDEFKGKNIVICDDDIYYRKYTIQKLLEEHYRHPLDVICHIGKKMQFSKNKELLPYDQWKWCKYCMGENTVLPIGAGTVLYPADIIEKAPLLGRIDLFEKLAPKADDIWFWFSIVKEGFFISIPKHAYKKMIYINPEREYGLVEGFTLSKINDGQKLNDKQLNNIELFFGKKIWEILINN